MRIKGLTEHNRHRCISRRKKVPVVHLAPNDVLTLQSHSLVTDCPSDWFLCPHQERKWCWQSNARKKRLENLTLLHSKYTFQQIFSKGVEFSLQKKLLCNWFYETNGVKFLKYLFTRQQQFEYDKYNIQYCKCTQLHVHHAYSMKICAKINLHLYHTIWLLTGILTQSVIIHHQSLEGW